MNEQEMVKTLAKLQILCVNAVEKSTGLRCRTCRDFDRIIQKNKLTCTYGEAAENLIKSMVAFCPDTIYLIRIAKKLKSNILNSKIRDFRFGLEPQKKFSEEEERLNCLLVSTQLNLQIAYTEKNKISIDEVVDVFGDFLHKEKLVELCENGELSNISKTDDGWYVDMFEVVDYIENISWSIYDTK